MFTRDPMIISSNGVEKNLATRMAMVMVDTSVPSATMEIEAPDRDIAKFFQPAHPKITAATRMIGKFRFMLFDKAPRRMCRPEVSILGM